MAEWRMHRVEPGWVALFKSDEGTLMSPIESKAVRLEEKGDEVSVNVVYFCPPPVGEGPALIAQTMPGFIGIEFLPMRMMAEGDSGKSGLWRPGRN